MYLRVASWIVFLWFLLRLAPLEPVETQRVNLILAGQEHALVRAHNGRSARGRALSTEFRGPISAVVD